MRTIIASFLLLSGISALTYQIVWVRLLGLSFGSTSAAISTVVAAFFFGLALGSYAVKLIPKKHSDRLSTYLLFEFSIGIAAIALFPLLLSLDEVVGSFPPWLNTIPAKFVLTFTILSVPTLCMGATFPVLTAYLVRHQAEIGVRIGELYGFNTLGAVVGALLAGFVFIPYTGLDGATYIAAFLNFLIVAIGWAISRTQKMSATRSETPPPNTLPPRVPAKQSIYPLLVLFITGFVSIATEIGWTKYLSIFTGTTIFGFSIILAVFLTGIFAGSWFIKTRIHLLKNYDRFVVYTLILLGISLLLTRMGLNLVPPLYEGFNHVRLSSVIFLKAGLIFILLLPPTFLLGMIFPVNIAQYCRETHCLQHDVGLAYAVNTIGAIGGSLAAGFWLIPEYGTDMLLLSMALVILAIATTMLFFTSSTHIRLVMIPTIAIFLTLFPALPGVNYQRLIDSVDYKYDEQASSGATARYLFLEEGKTGVISLVTYDNRYAKLQNNGLNESIIDLQDPYNSLLVENLLAYLPYFFHPNPKSAFIVGYGGGITTRAFTHLPLQSIRVVEMEPTVVNAVKTISDGPARALTDTRVSLEINDARNTLLLDDRRYDIIASQPSHPWLAGSAHVFTEEFFSLVRNRLNNDGIYSQWLNLFHMNTEAMGTIIKGFYNAFPHGATFANLETGDFILLGSSRPLNFDTVAVSTRMQEEKIKKTLARHDIKSVYDLLLYFSLSRDQLVASLAAARSNSDLNILSEIILAQVTNTVSDDQSPYRWLEENYRFDFANFVPPDQRVEILLNTGEYFLRAEIPELAKKIVPTLRALNVARSQQLDHKIYSWQADYANANRLYDEFEEKTDEMHLTQMKLLIEQHQFDAALQVIEKIQSPQTKLVAQAQWLYMNNELERLERVVPESSEEKKWVIAARARHNVIDYGKQLETLVDETCDEIPLLRVLIDYYHQSQQFTLALKYERRVVQVLDSQAVRYKQLVTTALNQSDYQWTSHLLDRLSALKPDDHDLERFRYQLEIKQRTLFADQNAALP